MGRWKLLAAFVVVLSARPALSQNATTGAIRGRVEDTQHHPFFRRKILIEDDRGRRSVETGADGSYVVAGLLPGRYAVRLEAGDTPFLGVYVEVTANSSTNVTFTAGIPTVSTLDPTSAALQFTTDRRFLNLPLASRYSDGLTAYTPTSRLDSQGVAFGDTTSYDNRYIVDGLDTTNAWSGARGTALPVEFLDSTTTTYGGGQSGRALGAQIVSVLRSGTNVAQGSVFARYYGSALRGASDRIADRSDAFRETSDVAGGYQVGATYAGPIVPDHAWFFVGASAQLVRNTSTLALRSLQDGDHNGVPDRDRNGLIWNRVSSTDYHGSDLYVPLVARVDEATRTQQGSLSLVLFPQRTTLPTEDSASTSAREYTALTGDLVGRWRSELGAGITLDVDAGWHRQRSSNDAQADAAKAVAQHTIVVNNFAAYAARVGVSAKAMAVCSDDADPAADRNPFIVNCPLARTLSTEGVGLRSTDLDERQSLSAALVKRVRFGGVHELRASASIDRERTETSEVYSGGQLFDDSTVGPNQAGLIYKLVRFAPPGETGRAYPDNCSYAGSGDQTLPCSVLGGDLGEADSVVGATSNIFGEELSDIWQPIRALAITGALRFDTEHLGGTTLHAYGSPRLGAVFSPLDDGRAKLFAQFARSTELLPASSARFAWPVTQSTPGVPNVYRLPSVFAFDPDLKPGSRDEWIGGGAYQVEAGTVVQASWTHRHLRRAIDDISLTGSTAYQTTDPTDPEFTGSVLANPGEGLAADRERARRDSDAFTLTASHRLAENWFFDAAYTRSRVRGNYPGVLDDATGQAAPNHGLSQFDVVGQSNLDGVLVEDRPDQLQLDGAYTRQLGDRTSIVLGMRFVAMSGAPRGSRDGQGNLLLPTGAVGRTDFVHQLDLHLAARRKLSSKVLGELFVDVFNVYDHQAVFAIDGEYTDSSTPNVRPIDGGTYEDLIWLKQTMSNGFASVTPAQRNASYGQPLERYAPISATVGARVTF